MKIFKLDRNIDGYGGLMKPLFFNSFDKAKQYLSKESALYYDGENWMINGMKECIWSESEDTFHLYGVKYPENEFDECADINWCRCDIIPVDLDFEIQDSFYILKIFKGYNKWLYSCLDNTYNSDTFNEGVTIGYFPTKKKARKYSKKYPEFPRLWNNQEEEKKISALGEGKDYLSISKVDVY